MSLAVPARCFFDDGPGSPSSAGRFLPRDERRIELPSAAVVDGSSGDQYVESKLSWSTSPKAGNPCCTSYDDQAYEDRYAGHTDRLASDLKYSGFGKYSILEKAPLQDVVMSPGQSSMETLNLSPISTTEILECNKKEENGKTNPDNNSCVSSCSDLSGYNEEFREDACHLEWLPHLQY